MIRNLENYIKCLKVFTNERRKGLENKNTQERNNEIEWSELLTLENIILDLEEITLKKDITSTYWRDKI